MRVLTGSLLLLLSGLLCSVTGAQESLTIERAVTAALEHNPLLQASRHDVEAARATARGARALANPEILIAPAVSGAAGSDEEFSLVQPLEINGQRQARTRVANAELQASAAGHSATQRETVRAVKEAYWGVAEAQAVADLNRENVQLAESLHQAAQRQLEVGTAPGAQAIKAQVEVSRARQELVRAETALAQGKAALNTLMGRPPSTSFVLADGLAYAPLTVNPASLATLAQASRPEVAEAQAQLAARRGQISVARARQIPDVTLQARQETLGGDGGWAVGVTLPLLDWGSVRGERKQAEAAATAQEQRIVAIGNEVDREVYSALREVQQSEAIVREYQQGTLAQAEQLSEMARTGYQAGATGYLEVLEAQRTLRSVRTEYYSALADHLTAVAQLEWAVGVELDVMATKEAK